MYYVAGISGFIGAALSRRHECYGIDRDIVKDRKKLRLFLQDKEETVINLSAYGNYSFQDNRNLTWAINVGNTMNLCYESQKLINFSSSSVLIDQMSDYALSKSAAERVVKFFSHITVRPSSVIGIGQQKFQLVPTLIRSCLFKEKMQFTEYGTHDFIDVESVVDAIKVVDEKGKDKEAYNISSGITTSNSEIKKIVEDMCGTKANAEYIKEKMRSYDCENWIVPNDKITELGWRPQKSLKETIKEMVEAEING